MLTAAIPSSTDLSSLSSLQTRFQQRASDWRQLAHALQTGDLATAQEAFNDIRTLRQNAPHGGWFPNQQVAQDFDALAQALDAGDLEAAQQAFEALRQDVRDARRSTRRFFPDGGRATNVGPDVVVNLTGGARPAAPSQATPATAAKQSAPAAAAAPALVTTNKSPLPPISSSVGTAPLPTTTPSIGNGSVSGNSSPAITVNFGRSSGPEIVFNLGNGASVPDVTLTLDRRGSRSEVDIQFANGPEIDLNFRGPSPAIVFNLGSAEGDASQSSGVQINLQA